MDIIDCARQLGKAIQESDLYVKLNLLQQRCDEDQDLQQMIGDFNLKRINLNNEINKPEKNQEAIDEQNREVRKLYGEIMVNDNMAAYNEAKTNLDKTLDFVLQIMRKSVDGQDPDTIEPQSECGGSCDSCAGCH